MKGTNPPAPELSRATSAARLCIAGAGVQLPSAGATAVPRGHLVGHARCGIGYVELELNRGWRLSRRLRASEGSANSSADPGGMPAS